MLHNQNSLQKICTAPLAAAGSDSNSPKSTLSDDCVVSIFERLLLEELFHMDIDQIHPPLKPLHESALRSIRTLKLLIGPERPPLYEIKYETNYRIPFADVLTNEDGNIQEQE